MIKRLAPLMMPDCNLNEYTFRFNRRNDVKRIFNNLLKISVNMPARTLKEFTEPERPYYINPEEE